MAIIEVDHVTKEFQLGQLQSLKTTTLNGLRRLAGKPVERRAPFKALDDVSFSIEQGEVVGIIGHNGAGKSTLLKLLARISTPTSGRIKVQGRVSPLIEVGAGLVADLTGRENIFLNGSILGMARREIVRKFDEIVAFAELEQFIDTPIKRYSSGMQVRLGFAIATSVDSEILIVDEVLAVGDLAFQRKCFDRTEELIKLQGRTVLIVSHNIRQIERMCRRVMLLDRGCLVADDAPKVVCDAFYARSQEKISSTIAAQPRSVGRFESTGEIEILGLTLSDEAGTAIAIVPTGATFLVHIRLRANVPIPNVTIGLGVHTTDFVYLTTHSSEISGSRTDLDAGDHEVVFRVDHLPLLPGVYMLRMGISCGEILRTAFYGENLVHLSVVAPHSSPIPAAMRDGFFALEGAWDFGPIPKAMREPSSRGARSNTSHPIDAS